MMINCRPAADPEQAVRRIVHLWSHTPGITTPDVVAQAARDYHAAVETARNIPTPAPTGTSVLERAEHALNAEGLRQEARKIAEADLKATCREIRDRLQAAGLDIERYLVDLINQLFTQADKVELPTPLPDDTLSNGWNQAVQVYLRGVSRKTLGELHDLNARIATVHQLRGSLAAAGAHPCNSDPGGIGGGYQGWPLIAAPGVPPMPTGDGRRMPEALGLVGHRITYGPEAIRAVTTAEAAQERPGELVPPFYPRWGG